jgi:diaminobutyrate-2-oxoglutarate transaminase
MMQGLDVVSGELAGRVCSLAFERGLVIETSGARDQVLKVLAPLNTPLPQLEQGLAILQGALSDALSAAMRRAA